jgi:hypothetical protein
VRTKPHVERLARLLHNRVVRRVLSAHPSAAMLLLVGDLVDGHVLLTPTSIWSADGELLQDDCAAGPDRSVDPRELGRWRALVDDLRPDFGLLARVQPVGLFVPYALDLRQLDLRLDSDEITAATDQDVTD